MLPKRSTREIVQGRQKDASSIKKNSKKEEKSSGEPNHRKRKREPIEWPTWAIVIIIISTVIFLVCMVILGVDAYRAYQSRLPDILEGQAIVSVSSDTAISSQISTGDIVRLYGEDGEPVSQLQYVQVYSVEQDSLLLVMDETQAATVLKMRNQAAKIVLLVHADRERAAEMVELQKHINNPDIFLKVPATLTVTKGARKIMECQTSIQPEEAELPALQWSSSDPDIVSVDDGRITGIAAGKAVISVTCGDVTALSTVTVEVPVKQISLSTQEVVMALGDTVTLTAEPVPKDATGFHVSWTSSDPAITNVSAEGVVTAVGVGCTTITAQCGDITAICSVQVGYHADMVQIDPIAINLYVGQSSRIYARTSPGTDVIDVPVYESSNPEVVSVSEDGTITGIAAGTATVTVHYGEASASCIVTVIDSSTVVP